jgi:hypothetical protein
MDGSKEIPIIDAISNMLHRYSCMFGRHADRMQRGMLIKKYWEEKLKKDEKDRPPGLENSYYTEFVMQQFTLN